MSKIVENLEGKNRNELVKRFKQFPNSMVTTKDVLHMLRTMSLKHSAISPTSIKYGDIFKIEELGHYGVILSVRGNKVYSILMTTTKNDDSRPFVIGKCNSRFVSKSSLTSTLQVVSKEYAIKNYVSVYDNRKHLREVKKELKKIYKGIL